MENLEMMPKNNNQGRNPEANKGKVKLAPSL
jgi:hypothetical protein